MLVKCLELDARLGHEGALHREVQSRESSLFRSYFRPMTWVEHEHGQDTRTHEHVHAYAHAHAHTPLQT